MSTKTRLTIVFIALFIALSLFFGNGQINEVQSARYYLNWTVDCAKGEITTIMPKYDLSFDWTDKYTGTVEKIVPLELNCKTSGTNVRKVCTGYITTRASRSDPMNKTHATCYAVP